MTPGRFITLEGGEGAGKSTQARLLADHLASRGVDVVLTREPGGTEGAEAIRDLLVRGADNRWDPLTETLLFTAARRDHLSRKIKPALARGAWVVCDRFIDSTLAYQSLGDGLAAKDIIALHDLATGGVWPDLTLLFDLPPEEGLARAVARGSAEARYEGRGLAFHEALRTQFLALAAQFPNRIVVVSACGTPELVEARVTDIVDRRWTS